MMRGETCTARAHALKYLLVGLVLVAVVWAEKVPNEADYPTEYQVVTTSAVSGGLMLGNFCTMGLKDGTHTFIAQKLR
jgi:ABC-type transporter Mla subunit MlaD